MRCPSSRRTTRWLLGGALWLGFGSWSGCHGLHRSGPTLSGREFSLQSVEGAELLEGAKVRLGFAASEFHFVGQCNRHFGNYQVAGSRLVVTSIGGTERLCAEEEHARDAYLSAFFMSKPLITTEGVRLVLSEDEARLAFIEAAPEGPERTPEPKPALPAEQALEDASEAVQVMPEGAP